jgi:DNA-binding GntR family transcriptional regulator
MSRQVASLRDAPSGTSAPFDNMTLWQRVHEHLRQEILSNRLPPGSELNEVELARSFAISRGPIREAMGRLAAEGLVTVRPRRGAVVRSLSPEEFVEAYQLREALEAMAARLAVPRLTAADHQLLTGLTDEMERCAAAGDLDSFFKANHAFHDAIAEASGNRRLLELYRQLIGQMGRYEMRSVTLRGNLKRSLAEHRAILRAARRGDADRAAHLVSEHIRVPQRRLEIEAVGVKTTGPAGIDA